MTSKIQPARPPRVEPRGGATRCPFCHAACDAAAEVVVCRTCLSRHHASCWDEGRASCASCGASAGLTAATGAPEPERAWFPRWLKVVILLLPLIPLGLIATVSEGSETVTDLGLPLGAYTRLLALITNRFAWELSFVLVGFGLGCRLVGYVTPARVLTGLVGLVWAVASLPGLIYVARILYAWARFIFR